MTGTDQRLTGNCSERSRSIQAMHERITLARGSGQALVGLTKRSARTGAHRNLIRSPWRQASCSALLSILQGDTTKRFDNCSALSRWILATGLPILFLVASISTGV